VKTKTVNCCEDLTNCGAVVTLKPILTKNPIPYPGPDEKAGRI
jgi:hypothetical protein